MKNPHAFTLTLVGLCAVVAGPATGAGLVPHQAVYTTVLASAESGSGLADARGAMTYKFTEGCDGWTVENISKLVLVYEGGQSVESTWTFFSWESKDGLEYQFRMDSTVDDEKVEELRGAAELEGLEGAGLVRFKRPKAYEQNLPRGTMFPTRHLMALLTMAEQKNRMLNRTVFDGATLDNPYRVSAYIGRRKPTREKALGQQMGLEAAPMWPIRLAFYPVASTTSLPDFEMEVEYRSDGIGGVIAQEFEGFVLKMEPTRVELLPRPNC